MIGTISDDLMSGSDLNDLVIGLQGSDTIAGNASNDTIQGDENADKLYGGPGRIFSKVVSAVIYYGGWMIEMFCPVEVMMIFYGQFVRGRRLGRQGGFIVQRSSKREARCPANFE